MAITATTPNSASSRSDTAALANTAATLGKDQFLQLLVAQLKHQDPTSPMDGSQFAAQLAQFSTVEQLMQMNASLSVQNAASAQALISQQAAFANSLIGRDVILNGGSATVASDGSARVHLDVGGAAATVRIELLAADGKTVVGSQDFTDVPTGSQTLTLAVANVPAGHYRYRVTAADSSGKHIAAAANTIGRVESTVFRDGQVMLRVDGNVVPVTDITEIIPAATPAETTNPK